MTGEDAQPPTGRSSPTADFGAAFEEMFRGPATIDIDGERIVTRVRLSARFEPLEGRYRWAGRTAPDRALVERARAQASAAITVGARTTDVRLSDPDPWGGVRLTGLGRPPWAPA